jgi:DUF1365 family protein
MESAIYEGTVRHRRYSPVKNAFQYGLFMMYLDLGELGHVFQRHPFWSAGRFNLACFLRRDHMHGREGKLDEAVRGLVEERTGNRPEGPIRILTHLRYFGHCFNPVSFYYCFDPSGARVETVVAEINNTPWKEQHCYVLDGTLDEGKDDWKRFRFPKSFHVSPFMGMEIDYDWRFRDPGERVQVHMINCEKGNTLFDATLSLERTPISRWNLTRVLAQYPVMTVKVVAAIYWQALKLKRKKAPFFPHPKKIKGQLEKV